MRPRVIKTTKPKIKIIHILSQPNDARERLSIASISPLQNYGIEYTQRKFKPFKGTPPSKFCATPQYIAKKTLVGKKVKWSLGPGAYGCYKSHRKVVEDFQGADFYLVCECDCILQSSPERFAARLSELCRVINERNIDCLGIGSFADIGGDCFDGISPCFRLLETHCLLYPARAKESIVEKFKSIPWDSYDLWLAAAFGKDRSLAVTSRRLAKQATGQSLISDETYHQQKTSTPFVILRTRRLLGR